MSGRPGGLPSALRGQAGALRRPAAPRLLAGALVFVTLSVTTVVMNLVDRFIFFPDAELVGTPATLSLAYEDVRFEATDGTALHGWWVPGSRPETMLWFHGNAGNISHRLDNLRLLHDRVGVNIFLFDYRQYGRSEGTASEVGLYADARGALAHLRGRADVRQDQIVYFGRSLGSAVAIDLATVSRPHALILESPFLSLRQMASQFLPSALSALLPASFDNARKITQIGGPFLFLHGDRDEIVPYAQGRSLFEAASPPKSFFTIRGAGHNDTYVVGGAPYFDRIRDFLDQLATCD